MTQHPKRPATRTSLVAHRPRAIASVIHLGSNSLMRLMVCPSTILVRISLLPLQASLRRVMSPN
jgi:hypothetical protein